MKAIKELIKINVSSVFIKRARCKKCGQNPAYYFMQAKKHNWPDPVKKNNVFASLKDNIGRICSSWYLSWQPRYFTRAQDFSLSIYDKGFNCSIFKNRGIMTAADNILELLYCECRATSWAFDQKSIKNRPEILNRKGSVSYPIKLIVR